MRCLAGFSHMHGVVVHGRIRSDQAVQGACDARKLDQAVGQRPRSKRVAQRRAVRHRRDTSGEDLNGLPVQLVGNDGVHPQVAVGHEARHLYRGE